MPTYNRHAYLQAAIECFLRQTYKNRELIILDDSEISSAPELDSFWPIKYVMTKRCTTGAKRNACCNLAQGEIICHFDDDDWSCPTRIADQVKQLVDTCKPVTGYSDMLYWHEIGRYAMRFSEQVKGYVCGMSLCYLRDWWKSHPFPDRFRGSDNDILYTNLKDIAPIRGVIGSMVARAHNANVGGKKDSVGPVVDISLIPAEFWENEKLIKVELA